MSYLKKLFTLGKNVPYQRGISYYNKCEYEKALKEFEIITTDRAYKNSLHYKLAEFYTAQSLRNLGIIAIHEARFKDAIGYFEKALKILPHVAMLHTYLGICYNNIGLYNEAISEFEKVLAEGEGDVVLTNIRLALAYFNKGDYPNAIQKLKMVVEIKPKHADLHYLLGLVFCNINDYKRGMEEFNKAVNINPTYVEALRKLGLSYAVMEKYEEAKETLQNMLKVAPEEPFAHYYLALTYNLLGDADNARKEFKEIKKLIPAATAEIKETYSKSTSKHILLDAASEEFSKAVMISATFTSILEPLESATKDIGLYNTLIRIYNSVITAHPTYADFHHKLGQVYENLHKHRQAIEEFLKAIEINPDYMHARLSLAFAYKEAGKVDKAIEEFQFVLSKQAEIPVAYFQLALLYKEKKDKTKAIDMLNKALELRPDFKNAKALLKELRG